MLLVRAALPYRCLVVEEVTYWEGVRARAPWAAIVALVGVLAGWWLFGGRPGSMLGFALIIFLSGALLPSPASKR